MKSYRFIILSLLFLLCQGTIFGQSIKVSSIITDAETGEPLPYVTVYVSGNKGAVTNMDGLFEIEVEADCQLKISYVGYKTLTLDANKVPGDIKMHQLATTINGVTVMSDIGIMKNVEQKLENDYIKGEKEIASYFNRVTIKQEWQRDMVEDIIVAKSANNLRSMNIVSGKYWTENTNSRKNKDIYSFKHTNIHKLITVGPLVKESDFWENFSLPFSKKIFGKVYECLYELSHDKIIDENDKLIYKLKFKKLTTKSPSYKSKKRYIQEAIKNHEKKPVLEGVMYIDAEDFSLLRMDAVMKGVVFRLGQGKKSKRSVVDLEIHADYKHLRGFTEVDNMSFSISNKKFKFYSILANVVSNPVFRNQNDSLTVIEVGENLIEAIDKTGENELYHNLRKVIKRTDEEQQFIDSQTIK